MAKRPATSGTIALGGITGLMIDAQPSPTQLTAAVLAGGLSRRMGRDKALEMVACQTLLERAVRIVQSVTSDVIIVGYREPYRQYGVPVIADAYPGFGPLAGIVTALREAASEFVLVVACDMPMLCARLLDAMAALPRDYDILVPVTGDQRESQAGDGTRQTLHAIYRRTCLARFEDSIQRGERQVYAAFDGLNVRELPESWLREYDPDLRSFLNANRPADLALVREFVVREPANREEPG